MGTSEGISQKPLHSSSTDSGMESLHQYAFLEIEGKLIMHGLWVKWSDGQRTWRRIPAVKPLDGDIIE